MDQKLDGIRVLKEKQLSLVCDDIIGTLNTENSLNIFHYYLCFYFKTLELLFVVNSGVFCCVVKINSLSITA